MNNKNRARQHSGQQRQSQGLSAPLAKKNSKLSWLINKQLFFLSLLFFAIVGSYYILQQQLQQFAISTVKIHGKIMRTSEQEIWDSIANLLDKGFFATNVTSLRTNLQKLPWVANAKVEKIWPDEIAVTVEEKIPLARWRGKGIVTTAGDIIYTEKFNDMDNLPIFWGNEKQAKEMLDNYLSMNDILNQHELSIKEIEIMPDQGVRAILSNGIMLFLGQEGLLDRINRFTLAYRSKLHKFAYAINYVDLRYVNGIAVGWKKNNK